MLSSKNNSFVNNEMKTDSIIVFLAYEILPSFRTQFSLDHWKLYLLVYSRVKPVVMIGLLVLEIQTQDDLRLNETFLMKIIGH